MNEIKLKLCPFCGGEARIIGAVGTVYSCFCGYSEDTCGVRYDNKTTYTGGRASDRTNNV